MRKTGCNFAEVSLPAGKREEELWKCGKPFFEKKSRELDYPKRRHYLPYETREENYNEVRKRIFGESENKEKESIRIVEKGSQRKISKKS